MEQLFEQGTFFYSAPHCTNYKDIIVVQPLQDPLCTIMYVYIVPDIPVPEIINDPGDVELLSESPGNVLAHTRWVLEPGTQNHF
jgi:hypothetical protein